MRQETGKKGGVMGKTIFFLASLVMSCAAFCQANKLALVVEPSSLPSTSESVFIRVVFTNTGSSTFTIPEPNVDRNLAILVSDEKDNLLSRSPIYIDAEDDDAEDDDEKMPEERVSLKPYAAWEMEPIDVFKATSPSFMIKPDEAVCVTVTYSLAEKEYKAQTTLKIPAQDLEIKPEYISKEKALSLARQKIAELDGYLNATKDITPTIQCVNGIYRVIYSRTLPLKVRGSSIVLRLDIDALTGKVLRVLGG